MTLKPWSALQTGKILAFEMTQTPSIQAPAFLSAKALADCALALKKRTHTRRRNSDLSKNRFGPYSSASAL